MESLTHRSAKEQLANWLCYSQLSWHARKPLPSFDWPPDPYFTLMEWPLCLAAGGTLFGVKHDDYLNKFGWRRGKSGYCFATYEMCIKAELLPRAILDIAQFDAQGDLVFGIEVVHKHDTTEDKKKFLRRVMREAPAAPLFFHTSAEWVLSHGGAPANFSPGIHRYPFSPVSNTALAAERANADA